MRENSNEIQEKEISFHWDCHDVPAEVLGEAFIGCGELFATINSRRNNPPLLIEVKDLKSGSIDLTLLLKFKDLVLNDNVEALLRAVEIATIITAGFAWIKSLKQRSESKDGELIKSIRKITRPIAENNGSLTIETEKDKVVLDSEDAQYVHMQEALQEETVVNDSISERYYSIVSLSFKRGNKWRIADSIAVFSVTIIDEDFLQKIDNQTLSFRSGDIMKCRIRTVQYQKGMCFRTEMMVEKVLDYKYTPKQEGFNFEGNGNS